MKALIFRLCIITAIIGIGTVIVCVRTNDPDTIYLRAYGDQSEKEPTYQLVRANKPAMMQINAIGPSPRENRDRIRQLISKALNNQ